MRIALGADHAGFALKERVKTLLVELKHDAAQIDPDHDKTEPVLRLWNDVRPGSD